jgi:hypothetical protein
MAAQRHSAGTGSAAVMPGNDLLLYFTWLLITAFKIS